MHHQNLDSMGSVIKFNQPPDAATHLPHRLSFTSPAATHLPHRLSFTSPISFSLPFPRRLSNLSLSVHASSKPLSWLPKPNQRQFSLLKSSLVAGIATVSVFYSLTLASKPNSFFLAPPPAMVASELLDEEIERIVDVRVLKDLIEVKFKNKKMEEAIRIVERLIELEPEYVEWPLMRGRLYCYNGNTEMAKVEFNELLKKDPTRVEAFHGLVMAAAKEDSGEQLKEIEKRVFEAMEICKREDRKDDLRNLKVLISEIKFSAGNFDEAVRVYNDLMKDEPLKDSPYFYHPSSCYSEFLVEAQNGYEKYRSLVPKGHPYAQYFEYSMIGNKPLKELLPLKKLLQLLAFRTPNV